MTESSTLDPIETTSQWTQALGSIGAHRSLMKNVLVATLGFILAWQSALAMALGKLIVHVWRGFRRA
jgi:hypothetical protein